MRVEPHGIGSILHVIKRGARGGPIVRDKRDRERFAQLLFYLNDSFSDQNWAEALASSLPFERPAHWPEQDPLVRVLAWTLLPNHFHLLLEEVREGGAAKFMQRVCGSMSAAFNAKYQESGSLFQGSYKSKTVDGDAYLRYLVFYIQAKNVLELSPGGLAKAVKHFDEAWSWSLQYPYSSLRSYLSGEPSPILHKELLEEMFPSPGDFKKEAQEMLLTHQSRHDVEYANLMLEPW